MNQPKANVARTVLQVIVAVLIALPIALAKVPIPSKYAGAVALVLGIAAGLVVIISVAQNAIEAHAGVALFRSPTPTEPVAPLPLNPHDAAELGPDARPRGPP